MNTFRFFITLTTSLLLVACFGDPLRRAENPDPNHTHADFAVYIRGEKVDFSGDKYMSGLSTDDSTHDEEDEYHHQHLHLHDNLGDVIHRHKPGLTLGEFFGSLDKETRDDCFMDECNTPDEQWRMFVNGAEMPMSLDYVFADIDQILLTYGASDEQVQTQLKMMTDEACLFSRTCPQRGDPPAENCIADPAVPCVAPLEDL